MIGNNCINTIRYICKHKLILIIVIVACILTLLPIIFDGQYGCVSNKCGFIIGTNYRDGVWFLAVAASAFKTIPFRLPNFSGAVLQGYHYLPNLLAFLLSLISIPITFTYYQLLPIIYIFLFIYLSINYSRKITDQPGFVAGYLFFSFFGIPLTIITSLYHFGRIDNSCLINTFQSTRILESIHFAYSFLILLAILIIIQSKKLLLKDRVILSLLLFIAFGTKFYTAAIILIILIIKELFILKDNKNLINFFISIGFYGIAILLSIILFYNPFIKTEGGPLFTLAPFATVHHIIETPSLFYILNLVNARYFLYAHGISPRLIAIELFSTFLFIIYYFGTRALGFIYIIKQIIKRKLTRFEATLTIAVLIAIILSILFVQRGDWFNPIQFAVVAAFIMNLFAAKFIFELFSYNKWLAIIIGLIIFILTFIPNLVNLNYLNNNARYVITNDEMKALNFLKTQPDGPVLSPIYGADSAYIPAFTSKPIYVGFTNVLENTGIPHYKDRENQVKIIETVDFDSLPIKYIYIPTAFDDYQQWVNKAQQSKIFKQIFINQNVIIFEKI